MILKEILKNLQNNNQKILYINEEKKYTYKEVYDFVKNMYFYLEEYKISNKPIVVYGHKSVFMIVCFLACSFLGIPYVPLDESVPKNRIMDILEKVKPQFILNTSNQNFFDFKCEKCKILNYYDIFNVCNLKKQHKREIKILMHKEDIYYIIFTSGTTGKPKGVNITYANLNSFVYWVKNIMKVKENVILNQAAFSFDLSVTDIYSTLTSSSCLIALNKEEQMDYFKLFNALKSNNIEVAIMTPSFADILISDKQFNSANFPNFKKILFCGEVLQINTVNELFKRFKSLKVINCYGPTECTVAVTSQYITKGMLLKDILPVGKVKKDTNIHILGDDLELLKECQIGQIAISGKSVGKGYFEDTLNTKKQFKTINNQLTYLTGDIGYIKNNQLYFLRRKDAQIKYKGYRIELSDIERNMYKLKYIDKVKIGTKKQEEKITRIVAYVKLKEDTNVSAIEIKKDLYNFLPKYMIPNIVFLKDFPINLNGKCDIKKLEEMLNEK